MEIRIENGSKAGFRFAITATGVRFGRSSTSDVQVTDESLSRNHCLFTADDDGRATVTDLGSANGTYVNGSFAGTVPCALVDGDVIEAGDVRMTVIGELAPKADNPDLGLAQPTPSDADFAPPASDAPPAGGARRGQRLVLVALALAVVGIAALLLSPDGANPGQLAEKASAVVPLAEPPKPKLAKLDYEKVEADGERIFRYHLFYDGATGVFAATADDVPKADRHLAKRQQLSEAALKTLVEILSAKEAAALGPVYSGQPVEAVNSLSTRHLSFVCGDAKFDTLVENTEMPDAFLRMTEALEAFSRNELGIWAIQFSGPQLLEMAERAAGEANRKYEEREVEYRNLSDAVRLYREALFYLDTVNPKPALFTEITSRRRTAESELDARYREQRFVADKAMNLRNWDDAKRELAILLEMVPENDDPRHAEASAKLVDVEKRMRKEGGKQK